MEARFRILMFPWLAQGHISPFLELAKRILKRKDFHIYFCSTAINFSSIRTFIEKNKLDSSIHLVELNLEPSPELPPHYHTTKNLPLHLNSALLKAFQTANSSYSDIITTLNPHLVIYDLFQPWAAKIARSHGIPAVHFNLNSGGTVSLVHHRYTHGESGFPFPAIHPRDFELETLFTTIDFLYQNIHDVDQDYFLFGTFKHSCEFVLVKSSSPIEGKYLDYLSSLCPRKIIPVGPLVDDDNKHDNSEIIQWLSKKSMYSTVYISFGSEYFLSKVEIQEIAKGLELIGDVNFIWVIRCPFGEKVSLESMLPQGFLDRVMGRGVVVTEWAPQKDILAHPSTGGFVSHCGWSSVMESMYFGVPVIAMPMKLDQPINAKVLLEAGGCVEVPRFENQVFKGEEIAKAITKVIIEGSGEGLRRQARELGEKMKMEEGEEMDQVANHLWQLCSKNEGLCKGEGDAEERSSLLNSTKF